MNEVITRLVDVPVARMFVLAGIIFLMIAVLGKVEGKIDPGNVGRVGASVLGVLLVIIGVAMQYIEVREASLERIAIQTQAKTPAATDGALPKQSAVAATSADKPAIKVVSGTYGHSCNAKPGNATALLAKACDGHNSCDFAVDPDALDALPNCGNKDFAAEWKCGSGSSVYSAALPAEALKNEKLRLACAG